MLKFGDKVKVIKGFFEGAEGRVIDCEVKYINPNLKYVYYTVSGTKEISFRVCLNFNSKIIEENLERI